MEWNGMKWIKKEYNGMKWIGMNKMEWNGWKLNNLELNKMGWNGLEWAQIKWMHTLNWNGKGFPSSFDVLGIQCWFSAGPLLNWNGYEVTLECTGLKCKWNGMNLNTN